MTLNKNDGTLRASLDKANPMTLADALRKLGFGSLLEGNLIQHRRRVDFHTLGNTKHVLSTLDVLRLPDGMKASKLLRAVDRVAGELTVDAYGTTPLTGHISIAPNGDIVTLTADNLGDVDVSYVPERCDVKEGVFPVASNAITLPTSWTTDPAGVVLLTEVESLEGTVTGLLTPLIPSASAATTGTARLALDKASVKFYSGDAVTRARVRVAVIASEDLAALLEAESNVL